MSTHWCHGSKIARRTNLDHPFFIRFNIISQGNKSYPTCNRARKAEAVTHPITPSRTAPPYASPPSTRRPSPAGPSGPKTTRRWPTPSGSACRSSRRRRVRRWGRRRDLRAGFTFQSWCGKITPRSILYIASTSNRSKTKAPRPPSSSTPSSVPPPSRRNLQGRRIAQTAPQGQQEATGRRV
jgi:hypothetical protein